MTTPASRTVHPVRGFRGAVRVPGDKSISHRLGMLCALADGESRIEGFLASEDCVNTLRAVEAMGAGVERSGTTVRICGTSGLFRAPAGVLDMGNSGTGTRLLAGLLAGQPFTAVMTGDDSLRSRPMRRIQVPLERMGARVELLGPNGCAPVRVTGGNLQAVHYVLPVASAQVKSCVLLAGLYARGRTTVVEPEATRDHTERVLQQLGAPVTVEGSAISVAGTGGEPLRLRPGAWRVPGDFSSAAFWIVAAACSPGAEVTVLDVGLNPRRTALLDVLCRMGADIDVRPVPAPGDGGAGEPMGSIVVRGRALRGTGVGGHEIPNLIDELPLVAAAGCFAEGVTRISGAAELRVKESDRIATMAQHLAALGADVQEFADGMEVRGPCPPRGGISLPSLGDHRVAMCMAVMACLAQKPVRVDDVACVATSYPAFWDDLQLLTGGDALREQAR